MNDLLTRLLDPGFTPGRRHFAPLLDLLAAPDEEQAAAAERALVRGGLPMAALVQERLLAAVPPARARLSRLLGRLASLPSAQALVEPLIALLDDPDLPTRRQAALALGKLRAPGVEQALLARWRPEAPVAFLRALTEALGKVGGDEALALLSAQQSDDPELRRLLGRARVMLERGKLREQPSARIDLRAPSPGPLRVVLRCKRGLEPVLLDEARSVVAQAQEAGPGLVRGSFDGPLVRLASLRVALSFGFSLPPSPIGPEGEGPALVAALTGPEASRILGALGPRPVRFRVAWRDGGHRRAVVWEVARLALEKTPGLVNDPSGAAWEVLAWARDGQLWTELIPRAFDDVRFAYRQADVPAASHPTVAAALARVAGVVEDDIVWDPFVGSGLELCERALLGPYAELHGSDHDAAALAVARSNLDAAGVRSASLVAADARSHRVPGLSLLISNPPLGRRVAVPEGLPSLLDAVVASAARQLRPGGRLVWLSPLAEATARAGQSHGLAVEQRGRVDLGGVEAELQVMRRAGGGRLPRR